jgi:hypothetical protein
VSPLGNGSVTGRCVVCDDPVPAGRPRVTCSDACRQALWRRRHQPLGLSAPPTACQSSPQARHRV